ncbi:MAG: erythromycin esterase family protein [Pseudomonadota bacterium]
MKRCATLFIAALALSGAGLSAEDRGVGSPSHLSFDHATPRGGPAGWYAEGDAATALMNLQPDPDGHGKELSVRNSGDGPLALYTLLPRDAACGAELSMSVHARSEGETQIAPVIFGLPSGAPAIGKPTPVGAEPGRLAFALALPGDCAVRPLYAGFLVFGSAIMDNVRFAHDGVVVESSVLSTPSTQDVEALASVSSPADLSRTTDTLGEITGRRIVGLGETSHGAASLFALKAKIVKTLAQRGTLEVFALEMPASAGDIVAEYVAGTMDDRDRAIRALVYPAWQTSEFMALIDWLRAFNETAERPVRFAGFDVQQPGIALTRLGQVWSHDSELLNPLRAAFDQQSEPSALLELTAPLRALENLTDGERRYIRLFEAGLRMDNVDLGGRSRGFHMAQEASRLIEDASDQVLLWADNTHVTRATGAMGSYLSHHWGDDYGAVGFTFVSGGYSAYGADRHYPAEPAYDGTHEHVLAASGLKEGLFALADLPADHPILEPRGFRYIGSRPQLFGEFLPHELTTHFDAIGFAVKSEPTNFLLDPEF